MFTNDAGEDVTTTFVRFTTLLNSSLMERHTQTKMW